MWRNVLNSCWPSDRQPCTDIRFLQDMLQVTLVRILDGIELVYVYQGIAVQSQLRIPALLKSMLSV